MTPFRLGFHYHCCAAMENGKIRMPAHQGRFIDALAAQCTQVVLFLHSSPTDSPVDLDYSLTGTNIRWVDLGLPGSAPRRILGAQRYVAIFEREKAAIDALLLRGPSLLLPALGRAAHPLPIALLLVGDAVAVANDSNQPYWRRKAIQLLWQMNRRGQDAIAKRNLTFVNSRRMYRELEATIPNLRETKTTTLTMGDFFVREDTCLHAPFHLLYTGRMTRGKGLVEIVEAVGELVKEGQDIVLDLVGWPEKGDDVMDEMAQVAVRFDITDRIKFHGPKAAGPELFAHYQQADLYVIASKTSEGFPRTIWEAMAHSLPVIATNVGSIPDFVKNAALVIKPNSVPALVGAIRTLLQSPEQRRQMIIAGRDLAKPVTLEHQTGELMRQVKLWAAEKR